MSWRVLCYSMGVISYIEVVRPLLQIVRQGLGAVCTHSNRAKLFHALGVHRWFFGDLGDFSCCRIRTPGGVKNFLLKF